MLMLVQMLLSFLFDIKIWPKLIIGYVSAAFANVEIQCASALNCRGKINWRHLTAEENKSGSS